MTGIQAHRSTTTVLGIVTSYYRKRPAKPLGTAHAPVVLFHGGAPGVCADLAWFRNFDALVDAGHEVIAFDQPGFGHSGVPDDHSIEFRYRHAVAFLQALEVESAHLVGNSIGGLLCCLIALRLRERALARSLVLAAPLPFFDAPTVAVEKMAVHRTRLSAVEPTFESIRKLCLNTFNQPAAVTDDLVALRLAMLQGDRWTAHKARAVSRQFDQDVVRNTVVDVPSLMVWGLNDNSLPMEIGVQGMQHFSDGQFLFVPHCGHWPQTEQAAVFNRAMLGFLDDQA